MKLRCVGGPKDGEELEAATEAVMVVVPYHLLGFAVLNHAYVVDQLRWEGEEVASFLRSVDLTSGEAVRMLLAGYQPARQEATS